MPGSPRLALLSDLVKGDNDIVIRKIINDAYYCKTAPKHSLGKLGAYRLIIAGWATDFCVGSTVGSALSHKFSA
ncbi:isochorismatase family protein [Microbulbifer epialgicus]|uniref:Isochorismatase family protein n=1 Tax=Microbulbifer epialgicus TaxID=393907 RepID=A0ABV4NW04_9GAMM